MDANSELLKAFNEMNAKSTVKMEDYFYEKPNGSMGVTEKGIMLIATLYERRDKGEELNDAENRLLDKVLKDIEKLD